MRNRFGMCGVTLLGLSLLAVPSRADEEKIPVEKLPAAVKKAVKKKFPEARVLGASKEVEDDEPVYEVQLKVEGHSIDMALDAEGEILEIEKEIPADRLPRAVRKRLAARYPGAKIEKAEEITKGEDGPVRYEVVLKSEVVFTAKGKVVKAVEEDEDDDKPAAKAKSKQEKEDEDEDEDDEGSSAKAKKKEKHEDKDDKKPAAKAKKKEKKEDKDEDDDDEEEDDDR